MSCQAIFEKQATNGFRVSIPESAAQLGSVVNPSSLEVPGPPSEGTSVKRDKEASVHSSALSLQTTSDFRNLLSPARGVPGMEIGH
jgi:hypothetical protein